MCAPAKEIKKLKEAHLKRDCLLLYPQQLCWAERNQAEENATRWRQDELYANK